MEQERGDTPCPSSPEPPVTATFSPDRALLVREVNKALLALPDSR